MTVTRTPRLFKDEQGVWHWMHFLPLFRDLSLLRTVLKAAAISTLIPALLLFFMLTGKELNPQILLPAAEIGGIIVLAILVLTTLIYFLSAAIAGGTLVTVYSMDSSSITLYQLSSRIGRAELTRVYNEAADAMAEGEAVFRIEEMIDRARLIETTPFSDIISLRISPAGGEIRVHSFLTWYSVHVNPEDFEYVAELMTHGSQGARIRRD